MNSLRLDWCDYKAAEYACKHWHYSHRMPAGKTVKIGVWENGSFIGAVIFGIGSGSSTNALAYGLRRHSDMAELCRVALTVHSSPVTRIVAIAIKMLVKQSPGLSLLVSFADPAQGHHGGIYAGGNWVYTGLELRQQREFFIGGKWHHSRTASTLVGTVQGLPFRALPRKHRFIMPLTDEMRTLTAPMMRPYPKRAVSIDSDASGFQSGEGGAEPTIALQSLEHGTT